MTDELQTVRKVARRIEKNRQELNAAIRSASAAGYSLRAIADAAQLSHQTVANILERDSS